MKKNTLISIFIIVFIYTIVAMPAYAQSNAVTIRNLYPGDEYVIDGIQLTSNGKRKRITITVRVPARTTTRAVRSIPSTYSSIDRTMPDMIPNNPNEDYTMQEMREFDDLENSLSMEVEQDPYNQNIPTMPMVQKQNPIKREQYTNTVQKIPRQNSSYSSPMYVEEMFSDEDPLVFR